MAIDESFDSDCEVVITVEWVEEADADCRSASELLEMLSEMLDGLGLEGLGGELWLLLV